MPRMSERQDLKIASLEAAITDAESLLQNECESADKLSFECC